MKVLVDTCIWSKVLRRHSPETELRALFEDLVVDGRLVMVGPIRQELLSGISALDQFDKINLALQAFEDLPIASDDFILAAQFFNSCRQKGIQGSHTDFLLCAIAVNHDLVIWTEDKDFTHYQKHLEVRLLQL